MFQKYQNVIKNVSKKRSFEKNPDFEIFSKNISNKKIITKG